MLWDRVRSGLRTGVWSFVPLLLILTVAVSCGSTSVVLTPVNLQLQWVTQSQFAGYYAAADQGFYKDEGLEVTILEGAVDLVPQQVVAGGQAEFGIAWVPKVLASQEERSYDAFGSSGV